MSSTYWNARHAFAVAACTLVALAVGLFPAPQALADETARARHILDATGVQGGLVVHVAGGKDASPDLTAALHAGDSYLVHGLYADAKAVEQARKQWRSRGLYGQVSADRLAGSRLPYTDNSVRLLVSRDLGPVPMAEVVRVLCPGGVAYVAGKVTTKPVPEAIDEWTHALHGPDNNAVARDTVVGPPEHLQWVGGPAWARSHDHLSSVSAAVTSGGRLFSIVDEGPAAAVALPAKWRLVARDAFSGVVLWKRDVAPWEDHLRGFRTGPAAISRRLVAVGDRIYVTLGYGKPATALDAATGKTVRTYRGTDDALEITVADGVMHLIVGPAIAHGAEQSRHENLVRAEYVSPDGKGLMALDAETGAVLWSKKDADTAHLMPTALAVADGRLYCQNAEQLLCLDVRSGQLQWQADRPVTANRWAWTAPTLVVCGDVVLSADRDAGSRVSPEEPGKGKVLWVVHAKGGEAPPGKLIAFSAKTGKRLWESTAREAYNSPPDLFVADGLVWTGILVRAKEPGITQGLDLRTGEVKRTRPPDSQFFSAGMGHHRCHRNKATERYLVLGRSGVEWIDLATGKAVADHWVRGACQYGVLPANGLLYAPSHSCACYIEAKLHGYNALAPARAEATPTAPANPQLEKGPAYGSGISNPESETSATDWPTYRHDVGRTGRTPTAVPPALAQAWTTDLGGTLTSPVISGGKVFVAQTHAHALHALDAATGKPIWSRTLGGRIDSPPTIYAGMCLVGCRDGYVTCLRASDGEVVWRLRAAPEDRRVVAYGQLESVWPVHGSILVHGGSAYFAAGRCSYVDGGLVLYRVDPATGKVQARKVICDRDPETGREPREGVRGTAMPGALPDVFSSDGSYVYMRHHRFDDGLALQSPDVPHLFSPAGFLDGAWWHRTYWMWGTRMQSGWGGWGRAGYTAPAGRIMVADESSVYAFGRLNQYGTAGTHVGLEPKQHPWGSAPGRKPYYVLFASSKTPDLTKAVSPAGKKGRAQKKIAPRWTQPMDLWVRAMVLAGDVLFLAGPPDPFADGQADVDAFEGKKGGILMAVSPKDGKPLATYRLSAPPAWDAMAAAAGRIYVATSDGKVTCLKGQ